MELEANSNLPLFEQLVADIIADIDEGVYAPGHAIPSERELAERYSVSRVTVRRAIQDLVKRGVLIKRQGKGTFVAAIHLERQITQTPELLTFEQMCRDIGKTAGTRVIGVDRVKGTSKDLAFLALKPGDELLRVQRVRLADQVPVMYENSYFPAEDFGFMTESVMRNPSILSSITEHTGRSASGHRSCSLRIAKASLEIARYLEVSVGEPLFLETVQFVDEKDEPLFIAKNYVVGSSMVFDF